MVVLLLGPAHKACVAYGVEGGWERECVRGGFSLVVAFAFEGCSIVCGILMLFRQFMKDFKFSISCMFVAKKNKFMSFFSVRA